MQLTEAAPGARILAFGGYQPARVVTNDDLAVSVDTTDEWIRSRVGIASRRIAAPDETVADMAVAAGGKALAASGLAASDIDLVIVATCTAEVPIPNVAATVATRLGIVAPGAYDLNAACAGFCYALGTASDAVRAGSSRHVLVIGAEKLSQWVDWTDRSTCIIFADGAGAAVVGRADEESGPGYRAGGLGQRRQHGRQDLHQGPELVHLPGGPGGLPVGDHRLAPGREEGLRNGGRRPDRTGGVRAAPGEPADHRGGSPAGSAHRRRVSPTTSCTPGTPRPHRSRWRCPA